MLSVAQSFYSKIKENKKLDSLWLSLYAVLLSIPIFGTGFYADDFSHLYINSTKYTTWGWDIFSLKTQIISNINLYRPTTNLFYILGDKFFGLNPVGYHLLQFAFFVGSAVLLKIFADRLLSNRFISNLAVIIFISFPGRVEPSQWYANICDTLMVFFGLLSLILLLKAFKSERKELLFSFLASVSYSIALLSKEPAVVLFVVATGLLLVKFKPSLNRILSLAIYSLPIIPYFLMRQKYQGLVQNSGYMAPKLSNAYLQNYILNFKLFILRALGLPNAVDKISFVAVLALSVALAIFVAVVISSNKKEKKSHLLLATWLVAFFFLAILPTINVPNFFDRYLYLASIPLSLLIALTIHDLSLKSKKLALAAAFLFVIFFSLQTLSYEILEYKGSKEVDRYIKSLEPLSRTETSVNLLNVPFYADRNYFGYLDQRTLVVNHTRYIFNLYYNKDIKTKDLLISSAYTDLPKIEHELVGDTLKLKLLGQWIYVNDINKQEVTVVENNKANAGQELGVLLNKGIHWLYKDGKQEKVVIP